MMKQVFLKVFVLFGNCEEDDASNNQHYKIINSCEITLKTGAGACVHSEIKCDIEQKSYSEVN